MNKTKDKNQEKINFSELFEPREEQQSEKEVQKAFNIAFAKTFEE